LELIGPMRGGAVGEKRVVGFLLLAKEPPKEKIRTRKAQVFRKRKGEASFVSAQHESPRSRVCEAKSGRTRIDGPSA